MLAEHFTAKHGFQTYERNHPRRSRHHDAVPPFFNLRRKSHKTRKARRAGGELTLELCARDELKAGFCRFSSPDLRPIILDSASDIQ